MSNESIPLVEENIPSLSADKEYTGSADKEYTGKKLGDLIEARMRQKGLTQRVFTAQLNERLGRDDSRVSQSLISNLVKGVNFPTTRRGTWATEDMRYALIAQMLDLDAGTFCEKIKKIQEKVRGKSREIESAPPIVATQDAIYRQITGVLMSVNTPSGGGTLAVLPIVSRDLVVRGDKMYLTLTVRGHSAAGGTQGIRLLDREMGFVSPQLKCDVASAGEDKLVVHVPFDRRH